MSKLCRSLAICIFSVAFATLSIAPAQVYTTIDFPGAIATTLNGGPNPEGTDIGSYTDTSGVTHGFHLKKGVFTSFDPPGSTATSPNWINPKGAIVGGFVDSSGVNHGFVLAGGKFTTVDFPGAAGTILTSNNPSGKMSGILVSGGFVHHYYAQFCVIQERHLHKFRSTRSDQQRGRHGDPFWCSLRFFHG
jgi:hypothetical protein